MNTRSEFSTQSALFNYNVVYEREAFTGFVILAASIEPLARLEIESPIFLSPDEQLLLKRMISTRRKEGFLRGRLAAKKALTVAFGGDLINWKITPGVFGQPIVQSADLIRPPVSLSISHSDTAALALVAPAAWPAAVDCETISPINLEALEGQLSLKEKQFASKQSAVSYIAVLTMMWSLKEAASKILGGGLAIDFLMLELKELEFDVDGRLSSHFINFAHLQGIATTKGESVSAIVFPESSKISDDIEPLMVREISILAANDPQTR